MFVKAEKTFPTAMVQFVLSAGSFQIDPESAVTSRILGAVPIIPRFFYR